MDGHTMTLRYKGGEQKIVVTDKTPIVGYEAGDRGDLKPGKRDLRRRTRPRPRMAPCARHASMWRKPLRRRCEAYFTPLMCLLLTRRTIHHTSSIATGTNAPVASAGSMRIRSASCRPFTR